MTTFNAPLAFIGILVVIITVHTEPTTFNCGNATPHASCGAPETLNTSCGNIGESHFEQLIEQLENTFINFF